MILNLVIKHLKSFGFQLLIFTIIILIFNSFMAYNDRSGSWWLFILITCGAVSMVIPASLIIERNYRGEFLSCSLPVSRKQIVVSNFIITGLIALFGYFAIYLTATILNAFIDFKDFYVFWNQLMLLIVTTYFLLFIAISIVLMSTIKNILWLVLADIIFLATYILGFEKVILPGGMAENPSSLNIGFYSILLWLLILSVIFYLSYKLSIKHYSKMEL